MSRQETILPPPSTPAGHQAKRVIIIALLRGAVASAYYVFMAERPAEARLQQDQRLEVLHPMLGLTREATPAC